MKYTVLKMVNNIISISKFDKVFKQLRKHLDKMPVGFPATFSGVERRLLKAMFNIDEAEVVPFKTCAFQKALPKTRSYFGSFSLI